MPDVEQEGEVFLQEELGYHKSTLAIFLKKNQINAPKGPYVVSMTWQKAFKKTSDIGGLAFRDRLDCQKVRICYKSLRQTFM